MKKKYSGVGGRLELVHVHLLLETVILAFALTLALSFALTLAAFTAFLALFELNLEPLAFGVEAVHGVDSLGGGLGCVVAYETKTTGTAISLALDTRADDVTERFEMLIQIMLRPRIGDMEDEQVAAFWAVTI